MGMFYYITSGTCEQCVAVYIHAHPFIKTCSSFFLSFH